MNVLHKQPKWKVYTILIAIIAVGMLVFNFGTAYLAYPTEKHRSVAASLNDLSQQAMADGNSLEVIESDEYKTLAATTENVYSTRMGIGSGVLSLIITVAITVAVYRYLRRHSVTPRPIGGTVLVSVVVSVVTAVASVLYGMWLSPIKTESPMFLALLAAVPFAVAISALFAFLIAKVAEWHYNRSHGFIED